MQMATRTKRWTLAELHSLPEDGNRYELLRGELFVTPPPTDDHETIAARLTRLIDPYVAAHGLGYVYHPRAVVQRESSQVEPDLQVRAPQTAPRATWKSAPLPILIVEILSPFTRRRDLGVKRDFYSDLGIAEYWIVDAEDRTVRIVRGGREDEVARERFTWTPPGMESGLIIELDEVFG